jgi:predicted ATPase
LPPRSPNRAFDAGAATRLYRETEGNPLFIVETLQAESGGGPPSVPEYGIPGLPPRAHAVIAGRLAQLSDHAREIAAAAAAVIGRAFDLDVLVRLVGDEEVVVRALDELWRKRIVREQGPNAYDFTHDKLRDVAYGETSAPQRRLLHRRVAEALVAVHEKDLGPVSAQLAAHCESAGLLEQAIPHYSRAALVAQRVYAHEEAIALAGRGLSLLVQLPASARRDGWELDLQLVLAPSYRVTLGFAAPELEVEAAASGCPGQVPRIRARGHRTRRRRARVPEVLRERSSASARTAPTRRIRASTTGRGSRPAVGTRC